MKYAFLFFILMGSAFAGEKDSIREKVEDLTERRLILEEHINLLTDEQIQSGEFTKLTAKIDDVDEELKRYVKLKDH